MESKTKKEGATKPAPDLVRFYNTKKIGFYFTGSTGKLGPGEHADILRSSAEYMVDRPGASCYFDEIPATLHEIAESLREDADE